MRERTRITALAIAILCACIAGNPAAATAVTKSEPGAHAIPAPDARIDINRASVDELLKIPGMTRSWAGRIVRFRPYHSKGDLLEHGVVSSQVYDRIKDYVIAHRNRQ